MRETRLSGSEGGAARSTCRSYPYLFRVTRYKRTSLTFDAHAAAFVSSAVSAPEPATNSITLVRRFADAMIEHSRENLPAPKLPLFPIVLTRDKFQVPRVKVSNLYTARVPQEFKSIANIDHDLNLDQIFYALTKITGEAK